MKRAHSFIQPLLLLSLVCAGAFPAARAADAPAEAALTETGKFGRALKPGRTFASAPALSALYFDLPRTVELWAKISGKETDVPLIAYEPRTSNEHWSLMAAKTTGLLTSYMPGFKLQSSAGGTVDIADGQWHYIALTFDGATLNLYVDAKEVLSQKVQKIHGYSDVGPLNFGHFEKLPPPANLLLDEVRLSNGIRKIDAIPDAPFKPDAQTMGLWHFDEGPDATSFADASVHHNKAEASSTDDDFVSVSPNSIHWQEQDHGPFFSSSLTSTLPAKNNTNKAISIRLDDGKAGIAFDTELLRISAAWTGGFMKIYPGRDGLGQHPDPNGVVEFGTAAVPGWIRFPGNAGKNADLDDPREDKAGPMPAERGRYKGLYLNGQRVILSYTAFDSAVLETFDFETKDGEHAFARTIEAGPSKQALAVLVASWPHPVTNLTKKGEPIVLDNAGKTLYIDLIQGEGAVEFSGADTHELVLIPPHDKTVRFKVLTWTGDSAALPKAKALAAASKPPEILASQLKGGAARWSEVLTTKGTLGAEKGAYVVDTLTAPYVNPWKSYLRFSGHDFFKNGDIAVCSISGDVWVVSGVDDKLESLKWRRYATGLFQPLGLRIVDDQVYVLGRDQITRLQDLNADGEADFYENFNNECKVTPGGHEYCTSLETDPEGNFYYTKCGNPTAHGGTMLKVAKDGSSLSVFATGLRNPNGMGVSPTGLVTTSDNEGEWVPASRLDLVNPGQFLGYTPMAHGPKPEHPGYPIWIPHSIDNSSGGQTWVSGNRWGLPEGTWLHTSYGLSLLYLVMPEVVDNKLQGGVYTFPLHFASGAMRARFNPKDGQLYVSGLKGWQTNAAKDGALQRVRYTGKTAAVPISIHAHTNGIRLTFTVPLDAKAATDLENWNVAQWNYRWSGQYGSKDWSVENPQKSGHDTVTIKSVTLSKDQKSVFLEIPSIKPVMQMEIKYAIETADSARLTQTIYNSIHVLRPTGTADDVEK